VIENEPVALFMKGTPQFVMCGNSGRALEALRSAGAPVTAVDILPDPSIRQELSEVSGWPTIPQVFVKGELVGGADITQELAETGEPFAVSICHCLDCQRRTGSAFGMQAGFSTDQVEIAGRYSDYTRISDEADRKPHVFHFCPDCGSQVFYTEPDEPDVVVVSVGSFADPSFPPPTESGYDFRRHPWLGLPDSIARR